MSFTTDATSGIGIPQNSTEWGDSGLSPYWAVPDHLWLCQELLGNLADSIGTMTLTKNGAPTFSNSVTGWSTKALHIELAIAGTQGFSSTASAIDISTKSCMWLLYVRLTGTPSSAAVNVLTLNNGAANNAQVVANNTPHWDLRITNVTGGEIVGTQNPTNIVMPLVVQYDRTSELFRLFTLQERIDCPWFPAGGPNTKGIGTIVSNPTSGPFDILYMAAWVGANAEIPDWQIRAGLNALNWSATSSFAVTYTAGLNDNTSTDHRLDVASSYIVGVSESESTSDALVVQLTAQPALAEALTTAEAFAATFSAVQGGSETVDTTEQLDAPYTAAPNLPDSESVSESVGIVWSTLQSLAESEAIAESIDPPVTANVSINDSPTITESLVAAQQPLIAVAESVTTSDSNVVGATYIANIGVSDGPTITDSVVTGQTFGLALTAETIVINEEIDVQATIAQTPNTITAGEVMGYVELGRTLRIAFTTLDRVGQAVDADSTPTMTLRKQGVALGYSPPITHVSTGTYEAVIAITSGNGFEIDKEISSYFTATINGLTVPKGGPSFVPQNFSSDDIMERISALSNRKSVQDGGAGHANIQRSGDGFATYIRVRVFADSKNLSTVTKGAADGADGELYRYTFTGTEDGSTGRLGNLVADVALEPTEP
jgi:hypothetical protein